MTPDDLAKYGLRVKRHYFAIYGTTMEQRVRLQTEYEDQICTSLEPIVQPDVTQAARVLLAAHDAGKIIMSEQCLDGILLIHHHAIASGAE